MLLHGRKGGLGGNGREEEAEEREKRGWAGVGSSIFLLTFFDVCKKKDVQKYPQMKRTSFWELAPNFWHWEPWQPQPLSILREGGLQPRLSLFVLPCLLQKEEVIFLLPTQGVFVAMRFGRVVPRIFVKNVPVLTVTVSATGTQTCVEGIPVPKTMTANAPG